MHQHPSNRAAFLAGLTLAAVLPQAVAGTLRIETAIGPALAPQGGSYDFTIRNEGTGPLDAVRSFAGHGHVVVCDALTRLGRSFTPAGDLDGGDSVHCSLAATSGAAAADAGVVVTARDGTGLLRQRTAHFRQAPLATPPQGVVAVLGGATHADVDSDGVLDAGETLSYHYTVLNLGTLALSGLALADNDGTVTCPQTTLAVGAAMACTHLHTISAAEAGDGYVLDTANVTGIDANSQPVQASDVVLRINLGGDADVRALKSPLLVDDVDNSGYASSGDLIGYTFVLKNSGAQTLQSVNLVEPDPSRIDGPITCGATTLDGQPFAGLGSGTLLSQDSVLCSAVHTISAVEAATGAAHNLADVSGQPGVGGPVGGTAASAVVIPTPASVSLAKTLLSESGSRPGIAEPGETLTYRIRLSNGGGADAFNVGVVDPLDPNVGFVAASNGGSYAAGTVTWSGLTVPGNGVLDLTVAVTVADPIPANATRIANLAYLSGDTPPDCVAVPLPDGCVVTPTAGIVAIAKSLLSESGSVAGVAEPGEVLGYAITLSNQGGSAVTGYAVSDPLDPNVAFVSADNGGTFAAGTVSWSNLTIPAAGSLVLHVSVAVANPLPAGVTTVVNVATATNTPPPDCTLVPTPEACVVTPAQIAPRLQVSKTVDVVAVTAGGSANYTITVRNIGTVAASNVVVSDPLPAGISAFSWTCLASGGASCSHASGSGAINETIPSFPVGGQLVYSVAATVSGTASGAVLNAVSVQPSSSTLCMPQQTPAPCLATATVTIAAAPREVPVDNRLALLLLGLGLAFVAARAPPRG